MRLLYLFTLSFLFIASVSNAEEYVEKIKRLANEGDADAQCYLGTMYGNGDGVPEDDEEAVRWYLKSANQGNAQAQCNLGNMYYNGDGVPKDAVRTYFWWNLAAAQGYADAKRGKRIISKDMTKEQISEAQKMSREWMENY